MANQTINVEDNLLVSMSRQPAFVAAFPFLSQLADLNRIATERGGCSSCSKSNQARIALFSSVKANLASLDADSQQRLKNMLGASQIRISYLSGGKRQERIF